MKGEKTKKAFIFLAILVTLLVMLPACAEEAPAPVPTPAPAPAPVPSPAPAPAPAPSPTTPKPPEPPASQIQKGGILRYIYPYSPTSTPGWPNDRTNVQKLWTQWTLFEPLVKLDAKNVPQPWLATSWEWGPQNMNVTFKLRKDVKFHDGTQFTAEAVKLEGDLVISTKESNAVTWDRWEIVDDYTVRLYLKQYLNDFWGSVSGINMCFVSPTAYKANGKEWMMEHPIGTGPFKFKSFEKDVSLKFVKNENYWQPGKPYLDEIQFITAKEPLTQQAIMEAGEGDVLALQQGKVLDDMKKLGFNVIASFGGTDLLVFDTKNADSIFSNVKVRMAIEYAINKQAMVDALGYGFLVANNQMSPPTNPGYNANVGKRNYDPAKAKQLLTEAGFPNGFTTKMITVGAEGKALAIQEYLKAVNITAQLESVDNAKFWNFNMTGWQGGMLDTGYAVGNNFPNWLKFYFPPTGIFDVSCKVPDAIVAKIDPALRESDPVKAKALSDEIVQMIFDDATVIPIYSNAMGYIMSPKVHGTGIFDWVDFSSWTPADTWLEK